MSAWRLGTRVGGNTNQSYEDKHYKKEVHSVQDLGRPTRRSWTQQAAPDRAQRWVSDMEHLFRGLPKSLELGRGSPRKYRVERRLGWRISKGGSLTPGTTRGRRGQMPKPFVSSSKAWHVGQFVQANPLTESFPSRKARGLVSMRKSFVTLVVDVWALPSNCSVLSSKGYD